VKIVTNKNGFTEEEKQAQFYSEIDKLARENPAVIGETMLEVKVNGKTRVAINYAHPINNTLDMAICLAMLAEMITAPEISAKEALHNQPLHEGS
jgi:hypothetical protein